MPRLFWAVPLPGAAVGAALRQLMRCAASEAAESPGTRRGAIGWVCTAGDTEEPWSRQQAPLPGFRGLGHPWQAAPLGAKLRSRGLASTQIGTSSDESYSGFNSPHLAQVGKTVLGEGSISTAEWRQARRGAGSGRRRSRAGPDHGWYRSWWRQRKAATSMGCVGSLLRSPLGALGVCRHGLGQLH